MDMRNIKRDFTQEISIPQAKAFLKRGSYIGDEFLLIDDVDENSFPLSQRKLNCLLILLCEEGTLLYKIDRHKLIAHTYDICIFNVNQTLYFYNKSRSHYKGKAIMVAPSQIQKLANDFCSLQTLRDRINLSPHVILDINSFKEIIHDFQLIQQQLKENSALNLPFCLTISKLLLQNSLAQPYGITLHDDSRNQYDTIHIRQPSLFDNFEDMVSTYLHQHLKIPEYCQLLHTSYTQLARVVKEQVKLTPQKYIHLRQVNYICTLIESTTLNNQEIAQREHYKTSSQMNRLFKNEMQISINTFRHLTPYQRQCKVHHTIPYQIVV